MKTKFIAKLENGTVISDMLYFTNKVGKGILRDVFENWVIQISNTYCSKITNATYTQF